MRILTMCQEIKKGGFYERYLSLVRAMLKRGWEVHYISTQEFPIRNKNLHFHRANAMGGIRAPLFARFVPRAMTKSLALVNRLNFDRIVVFGSAYAFMGWLLKKTHDIPMITFLRADILDNLRIQGRGKMIKPVSVMQKFALKSSDKIIINTPVVGEKIRNRYGIPEKMIELIHNDIPAGFRKPAAVRRTSAIGFVGVLEKRKGIDMLLEAYEKVHAQTKRKLLIVGDGPMKDYVKKTIRKKGLEGSVSLLGWKEKAKTRKAMSSLSLLIAPSLSEGCPNTVLEALGCGTPCIGSEISEIREILLHDELLFKPEPDALAQKILYATGNMGEIRKLCSERRKGFIFDWEGKCIDAIQKQTPK